jgi:uncharacterized protein (DUF342 family)
MDIVKNDYIRITKEADGVYIETFRKGYSIHDFNVLISNNPEIRITSFIAVRNALLNAPHPLIKFGEVDERIVIELTDNDLKAYVTLHVDESELQENKGVEIVREILQKLRERGIIFGIKTDALMSKLRVRDPILIAEGIPPVNGQDSVIRMFELKEPKPELKEDGKTDHYELNIINKVTAGDWLGDRTDPTEGVPGKSVKGETIHQLKGRRLPLFYDENTVREEYKDGVTTLYAKVSGAVHYNGDKISVSNHLEILNDIDFNTGNIDFDGYLTVKGSVADNFSVSARDDIEILGEYGIGSVKEVASRGGNILIKGGIAGKNKAVVKSTRDLYTKYISDATIICEGIVHVGFYCLNSYIRAKQVIVESAKGKIIGGVIEAEQKVEAAYIGNEHEVRTVIKVTGFDRVKMKEELDSLQNELARTRVRLSKAKQNFALYAYSVDMNSQNYEDYKFAQDLYFKTREEVRQLEQKIRTLQKYFRVKGEGEVSVLKRIYPNTQIQIKNEIKEIKQPGTAPCYFIQDGVIKEL